MGKTGRANKKYAEEVKKETVRLAIRITCSIERRAGGLRNMTQTKVASLEEVALSAAGRRFGLVISSGREGF